jgi:hypothetical protein
MGANEKLWDLLISGGIFMGFIVICSFVALAVSIHRLVASLAVRAAARTGGTH